MKIAVITPYYQESLDYLQQCHQSVLNQDVEVDHFFIADGYPREELLSWKIKHISLPQAHADNGNTPRGIGGRLADAEGYTFITYLDADNWYHPGHLKNMLDLWQKTRADVCASYRTFHALNGQELKVQEKDEMEFKHVDTSCLMLHRRAFDMLDVWLKMPKQLSPICDRIFYAGIRRKHYRLAFTRQKSVAFRSQYASHYEHSQIDVSGLNLKRQVTREPYQWLLSPEGLHKTVDSLGYLPL
jgi:glycosyltransferase involved in cell wall biosynthesis